MMRRLGATLACCVWAGVALAQSNVPVYQTGLITPGHVPVWATNGVVQDDIQNGQYAANAFGITAQGLPLCINDALTTNSGGFHQFCMGANVTISGKTGAFFTYNAYGGAADQNPWFNINGTNYEFPFTLSGIVGPATTTVGDAAVWTNTNGTLLGDPGTLPAMELPTIAALEALSLSGKAAGYIVGVTAYSSSIPMSKDRYSLSTSACVLNAGAGDGGSQIPSNTSGNCWLLLPTIQIDISNFGAAENCTTDDTTPWQNAINYVESIAASAGIAPTLTTDGLCSVVSSTLNINSGTGISVFNTKLKAANVSWSGSAGMIDVEPPASNVIIYGNIFDGSEGAPGVTMNQHAANSHFDSNYMFHVEQFGLKANGVFANNNTIVEWLSTDSQYATYPGDFTTLGIWLWSGGDAQITNNTVHDTLHNFEIGAGTLGSPTSSSTHNLFIGNHPWFGVTATNPCDEYIHDGSTGSQWYATYQDHGQFCTAEPNFAFHGSKLANIGGSVTLTSWFDFIATVANETMTWTELDVDPNVVGGSNVPLSELTTSGGGSWSTGIPPAMGVSGITTADAAHVLGPELNFVFANNSLTPLTIYGGNSAGTCIGLTANGNLISSPATNLMCTYSSNDIGFSVPSNQNAFFVTAEGNIGVSADGSEPTCTGCGSGYTVIGGNVSGVITLGTSPSSSIVISFAVPAGFSQAWSHAPNCDAWEAEAKSDLTSNSATVSVLNAHMTSPTAGNTVHWSCIQMQQ